MTIAENREKLLADVKEHQPDAKLIAVSKKQPEKRIQEALDCGHRLFGENRVQEAYEHWENKKSVYPDLELHLIGPLQTNKVKEAVALFDVIQTVDREKLAKKLSSEMQAQERQLSCLIQVNTGEEEQKSGILPKHLPDFAQFCRQDCALNVTGLMCIPPFDEPPALHFALLKKLARENNLNELSMGMTNDYHKALNLKTTYIRVGSGFFGARLT